MKLKITADFIEQFVTDLGGYRKSTLDMFGVDWPPPKNWKADLIGRELDLDDVRVNQELDETAIRRAIYAAADFLAE